MSLLVPSRYLSLLSPLYCLSSFLVTSINAPLAALSQFDLVAPDAYLTINTFLPPSCFVFSPNLLRLKLFLYRHLHLYHYSLATLDFLRTSSHLIPLTIKPITVLPLAALPQFDLAALAASHQSAPHCHAPLSSLSAPFRGTSNLISLTFLLFVVLPLTTLSSISSHPR